MLKSLMQLSSILIAILFGLGAMLGWGSADFFSKKAIDKVGYAKAMFYMQLSGIFPLLLITLLKPTVLVSITSITLVKLAIFALIYIIAYLFLYLAFEKGQLSIVSPVGSSWSAFAMLFSILIFHEQLSLNIIFWLIIIILGILILSTDLQSLKQDIKNIKNFRAGTLYALAEALIIGLYIPFYDNFISNSQLNPFFILLIFRIFMTIYAFIYAFIIKKQKITISLQDLKLLIFAGFLDVFAYSSFTLGLNLTNHTSIVSVLSATFTIPTIILAQIFLKERITKEQLIGIGLIVAGIVFLVG